LETLSLARLGQKLITLLALVTAQRSQTLGLISINQIKRDAAGFQIAIPELVKHSKPGTPQPLLKIPFFRANPRRCPATTLDRYMQVTTSLRPPGLNNLFLCSTRPFGPASLPTLRRWIRQTLQDCGVEAHFAPHSTRHAATSAAWRRGVDVDLILRTAGWSAASSTFANHYHRPLSTCSFASSVLGGGRAEP